MKVAEGTIVTLSYDITTESGEIIESSDLSGPITFLQGKSGLIPGLDKRLVGLTKGDEESFVFPPEEAFGRVEDAPTRPIPRNELPPGTSHEVGAEFEAGMPGGHKIKLHVLKVEDGVVTVRMIHPLAGQSINMSLKVLDVRDATAAEKAAGQAMTKPPPPPPKAKS